MVFPVTSFSYGYKRSSWVFSLFSFPQVVGMEWWFTSFIHPRPEIRSCYSETCRSYFAHYCRYPSDNWKLVLIVHTQKMKAKDINFEDGIEVILNGWAFPREGNRIDIWIYMDVESWPHCPHFWQHNITFLTVFILSVLKIWSWSSLEHW